MISNTTNQSEVDCKLGYVCLLRLSGPPAVTLTKKLKYKNRLLLRCIHHFISDLIDNMDHMRISGIETSSVIQIRSNSSFSMYALGIGSICMLKGNFNRIVFFYQNPVKSVGRASSYKSQDEGSSPSVAKTFHIVCCRSRRAPGSSTGLIQMKSSMTFVRANRFIERMIIWKKNLHPVVILGMCTKLHMFKSQFSCIQVYTGCKLNRHRCCSDQLQIYFCICANLLLVYFGHLNAQQTYTHMQM